MAAWIKMRGNLWDDPRVAALVDATDTSEAAVIGALYWLWATADDHTTDGMLTGMTVRQIDRKTGVPGFASALDGIGWIEVSAEGVRIIRFDEHNGASAKRRASESRRKVSARDADRSRMDGVNCADSERNGCGGIAHLEEEEEKEEDQERSSATAAPSPAACGSDDPKPAAGIDREAASAARAARLAQVTRDAIETFNASKLTKANGGLVPNVDPDIGADKRRKQVAKSLQIASGICRKDFDSPVIVREFWADYWELCFADEHKSGRAGGGKDHANWLPSFEYLTREATMLEVYDRAVNAASGGAQ